MNVLLAEDDGNLGFILKNELEEDGITVDLVQDGLQAVLRFIEQRGHYHFVLLDLRMPKINGIATLKIISSIDPAVPVITLSGNAGSGEKAESVRAGAIRCLSKPFDIAELKNEIQAHSPAGV